MSRSWGLVLLLVLAWAGSTTARAGDAVRVDFDGAVRIAPGRGVDPRVDYGALVRIGPWDDRNYDLTREDLSLLSPDEGELRAPLPVFFRVGMRRALAEAGQSRLDRYPLSALNVFRQRFGGYRIDGTYYRRAVRRDGRYWVDLRSAVAPLGVAGVDSSGTTAGVDAVSGDVRVTSPNGAAESAIAINPADTTKLIAGSNGPNGGQRMHYSADGGATWTQTELPLGGTCCDPTVEWSSNGQFGYTATLGGCFFFCQMYFYRTDDGGVTWNGLENVTPGDPRRELATSADREFMHVDHAASSPHKDNIYITWHSGNVLRVSRSTDFGNTFSTVSFSSASDDRGIAGDVATDRSGTVYHTWPSFNSRTIRLSTSTDGGASFGPISALATTNAAFSFPIPAMESREVAVYVASEADTSNGPFADSVYLAWTDSTGPESPIPSQNHARIQVAFSRDGGATWTITTPHETADETTVDRWQPFLAVGPDGTVHVIFNDTRRSGDRTAADVFYAFSTDGAVTWSAPRRVTSEMSPNIQDGFEFGDYSGLDIVMSDLVAIFTDNRNESGGGGDSVDVYAAGITPGGGAGRIPGARDVPGPPLTVDRSGTDLLLDWAAACGSAQDYAVYEGTLGDFADKSPVVCSTGGATSATVTPAPGQRFFVVVATSDGSEGSYGKRSDGVERAPSAGACFPQTIGACP